jgi:hypothetical protein
MKLRRTLTTAASLALVLGLTQTTIAHGGKRCHADGTAWVGNAVGFTDFTATFQAGAFRKGRREFGSMDLELINPELTLGGFFPDAFSGTDPIGVWRRTGPRSLDWNWLMHVFDEFGAPVYVVKAGGGIQFSGDCLEADITAALELYAPGQDPLGDEPPTFGCVPFLAPASMKRMEVVTPSCFE